MATTTEQKVEPAVDAGLAKALRTQEAVNRPYDTSKSQLMSGITEAQGREAKAKQEQERILAEGARTGLEKETQTIRGAQETYQKDIEAEPLPAFVPSKESAQDIAGLFSLISVIGAVAGKRNAQLAMGNMNGMLEGHRKGRADLYKKERNEFDTNFKAMLKKHEEFRKKMEDAIKLAPYDKEKAMADAKIAAVEANSEIVKAQLDRGYLTDAFKTVDGIQKGIQKVKEGYEKEAAAERRHRETIANARENARLAREQALKLAEAKASAKTSGGAAAGQIERMVNAMSQVSGAINSLAQLPVTTTSPVFGQKEFSGLFTAPLSVLNQKMSKETSQMMQDRLTGVGRNLASLETGGAATGLADLTKSIQAGVGIPAGAKLHVALDKLAEMRRIVDDAGRAALSSSKYTDEQKQLIRENMAIVEKAIPFTLQDVVDAVNASGGKSPKVPKEDQKLSFTDYVNKYGVGSSKDRAEADAGLTEEEKAELAALRAKHGRTQ